jgi:seryl-tRNA synthetase
LLDIKVIRDDPEMVRKNLERRRQPDHLKNLDALLKVDARWRELIKELDALRNKRNNLSKEISERKRSKLDAADLIKDAGELPQKMKDLEAEMEKAKEESHRLLMRLPNLLHDTVPYGADDKENAEIKKWGKIPEPQAGLLPHGELAEKMGIADFDRAAKIAGAGFNYLLGDLAYLDLAIINYAVDFMRAKGYTLVEPPFMMRRRAYEGVTDLADFENVMYKIDGEDLYLIATSEHPMAAMFQDEIIDEDKLPIKFVGMSTCFRREIGSRGVDTKGLFRMHQFNKIEQFIFCRPEDSWKFHEELLSNTEGMFQGLGIPYHVVNVCTGDLGIVAAKKYDIEAWFPRQNKYGEVASCSNCTDYQARRLNIRMGKVGGDKRVLHTLNNTAIATSRCMVAILENYQRPDGSIEVPKALRRFMNNMDHLEPLKK